MDECILPVTFHPIRFMRNNVFFTGQTLKITSFYEGSVEALSHCNVLNNLWQPIKFYAHFTHIGFIFNPIVCITVFIRPKEASSRFFLNFIFNLDIFSVGQTFHNLA